MILYAPSLLQMGLFITAFQKLGNVVCSLKLELLFALYTTTAALPSVTLTTLILDKSCRVSLGYGDHVCSNLANFSSAKTEAEKLSADYRVLVNLLSVAPSAMLAIFVGPWSDKYGRKLPMAVGKLGILSGAIGNVLCSVYIDTSPAYLFIPALLMGMSGSLVTNLAFYYSYATDMTSPEERTFKIAKMEISTAMAAALAIMLGGWLHEMYGFAVVFAVNCVVAAINLLGGVLLLPETRGLDLDCKWRTKLWAFFSLDTFRQSIAVLRVKRPNKGRRQIILLIMSMCLVIVAMDSTGGICFLFVHHQFNWDNETFSSTFGAFSILGLIAMLIVVPVFRHFKTDDPVLGVIGTCSIILQYIGIGLAYYTAIYYTANAVGMLQILAPLAVRSRISKLVSSDDIGKVFGFIAIADTLLPVVASVAVVQVFNAFLEEFPGMPYILLAGLLFIPLSVFIWMLFLPSMKSEKLSSSARCGTTNIVMDVK